jgi:hypothetical protein
MTLLASGRAEVDYHPVGYLDDSSTPTGYFSRAAAALACAPTEAAFLQLNRSLLLARPAGLGPGLTDARIGTAAVAAAH